MKLEHLALAEPLAATGDGLTFEGYAAVFDLPSEDMGGYRIVLRPGAFTRSLNAKRDIRMYLNHDDNIVLGSTRAGTLTLAQDDHGLKAMAKLPDNEWGRPVADGVARGDIHTMSIGFNSVTKSDVWSDDHSTLFKSELILHEVSPITSMAAFPQTSASVFALAQRLEVEQLALADAIDQLGAGEPLTAEQHDLLVQAAAALAPAPTSDPRLIHAHHLALRELKLRADLDLVNSEF